MLIWTFPKVPDCPAIRDEAVPPETSVDTGTDTADIDNSTGTEPPDINSSSSGPSSGSFLEPLFKAVENTEKVEADIPEVPKSEAEIKPVHPRQQEPEPVIREQKSDDIYMECVEHEIFVFSAEGEGWLLENITDAGNEPTDRIRFSGREYTGNKTFFSFYPYKAGNYVINIKKADYSTGLIEKKTVRLEVLEEFSNRKKADGDEPGPEVQNAVTFDEDTTTADSAGIPQQQEKSVVEAVDAIEAASGLSAAGDCRGAAELLEKNLDSIEWTRLDEAYFMLAGYYENCRAIRDERVAAGYYKKIVDYYPVSIYWEDAKARLSYLYRNYLHIR